MGDAKSADGRSSLSILSADEPWNQSSLGHPSDWPRSLQSFAAFIMTLPHPAAIFWGSKFAMIHNEPWREANAGASQQGKEQAETISESALGPLRSALEGRTSHHLASNSLMKHVSDEFQNCSVLLSPLFESTQKPADGVIAQILLGQQSEATEQTGDQEDPAQERLSNTELEKIFSDDDKTEREDHKEDNELAFDERLFFKRFAEMLPIGLAILNHNVRALFVNKQFYELTTHEGEQSFKSWPETIHPDDYERVMTAYDDAFKNQKDLCVEFRSHGLRDPWRQMLMRPLKDDKLQHASLKHRGGFICAIIDITEIKAAELSQRKAAKEAEERKEQQERFVDMISHEIRNPLSAVLHCAEDILDAVQHGKATGASIHVPDIVEAAETITLCVSHQKNIVDDILSFSKLDANMLSLSPRSTRPRWHLSETLKMFQPELRKQGIQFEFKIDISYVDNHVNWVMADLVRISQVVVNLLTNAIKFTSKKDGEKKISVAMGVSVDRPTSYPPNVVFFDDAEDKRFRMDATRTSEWGNGEALYILVAVKDTGIGISAKNQAKLFERFRQATPKTEEIYGGSGLGLSISRKLCQLHGGDIGVSSQEGHGSTFGFFFRVRRSEDHKEEEEVDMEEVHEHLKTPEEVTKGPIDDADVPDSLKDPVVEKVDEANPSESTEDNRYQHTAQIASDVKDGSADKHGASEDKPDDQEMDGIESEKASPQSKKPGSEANTPKKDKEISPAKRDQSLPNVLLVEDNLINQRILRKKLESKGFGVTTANNGREAVNAIQNSDNIEEGSSMFGCVLMDQEMPVMDGNAATKAIRKLEDQGKFGHVPILGVTANVREEQKADMKKAGMDEVISKPYKIEEIVEMIKRVTAEN